MLIKCWSDCCLGLGMVFWSGLVGVVVSGLFTVCSFTNERLKQLRPISTRIQIHWTQIHERNELPLTHTHTQGRGEARNLCGSHIDWRTQILDCWCCCCCWCCLCSPIPLAAAPGPASSSLIWFRVSCWWRFAFSYISPPIVHCYWMFFAFSSFFGFGFLLFLRGFCVEIMLRLAFLGSQLPKWAS